MVGMSSAHLSTSNPIFGAISLYVGFGGISLSWPFGLKVFLALPSWLLRLPGEYVSDITPATTVDRFDRLSTTMCFLEDPKHAFHFHSCSWKSPL